jgi:hypothetical protein
MTPINRGAKHVAASRVHQATVIDSCVLPAGFLSSME